MEIWKDINGFDGLYQISNLGRIKRIARITIERNGDTRRLAELIRATRINTHGYPTVTLRDKNKKEKTVSVHRLLAIAFIPNPNQLPQVNHKNGIKTDYRLENLEWCTARENTLHAIENGLAEPRGENHGAAKLTDKDVLEIRRLRISGMRHNAIAKQFNIHYNHIKRIVSKKSWKHLE